MPEKRIEDIAGNFLSIFPLMNRKIFKRGEALPHSELTPNHFFILKMLQTNGKLPTTEIGEKLSIQKSNLTPLINKLIKKEYARRIRATHDRRVIYIQLTQEGEQYLEKREQMMHKAIEEQFNCLEEDDLRKLDESLKTLKEVFSKLT